MDEDCKNISQLGKTKSLLIKEAFLKMYYLLLANYKITNNQTKNNEQTPG